MKKIVIKPRLTDKETDKLRGVLLSEKDYNTFINYDADIYCEETNKCIAKFRKKIIPANIAEKAYENLKDAAQHTNNRSIGNGDIHKSNTETTRLKKDGTIANTKKASKITKSGIIGYFDRNARFPYCRQTAFNEKQFEKFKKAYPIIKLVDTKYAELMPEHYALQRKIADETSQDFVIKNTAFTTVTVNKNWQTAVHTDKGDYAKGFGNLVVLRKGRYTGGYFVLPKWGVAFDMQNCDLLLVDVHQWHGNTPINKIDEDATRVSLVMYYRENMISCGTADEEVNRAKNRKAGSKLN
ncbi:MAG: hypothetical protein Unbinned6004contig1002_15 [Prokaryotic dsDNA virus sp.]|nr:MAG: hypothetical protein Unbinned6004contig1002_15 [Prokaryotic dsDNA virus sp.]|tara:strand:- start:14862 stop:15752 length:891 start_codon:yes stop_codon:yes gene_type:complete